MAIDPLKLATEGLSTPFSPLAFALGGYTFDGGGTGSSVYNEFPLQLLITTDTALAYKVLSSLATSTGAHVDSAIGLMQFSSSSLSALHLVDVPRIIGSAVNVTILDDILSSVSVGASVRYGLSVSTLASPIVAAAAVARYNIISLSLGQILDFNLVNHSLSGVASDSIASAHLVGSILASINATSTAAVGHDSVFGGIGNLYQMSDIYSGQVSALASLGLGILQPDTFATSIEVASTMGMFNALTLALAYSDSPVASQGHFSRAFSPIVSVHRAPAQLAMFGSASDAVLSTDSLGQSLLIVTSADDTILSQVAASSDIRMRLSVGAIGIYSDASVATQTMVDLVDSRLASSIILAAGLSMPGQAASVAVVLDSNYAVSNNDGLIGGSLDGSRIITRPSGLAQVVNIVNNIPFRPNVTQAAVTGPRSVLTVPKSGSTLKIGSAKDANIAAGKPPSIIKIKD